MALSCVLETYRVFYEYLHLKGLNPSIQFGEGTNTIDKISGYKGAAVSPQLNIKITAEVADAINHRMYNASQCIPGTKFILPAYQIDASSLVAGELRYNGILFANKSEWKNLLVMPTHQILEWTIKIPSIGFMERTKVCVFHKEKNSVVFKFDVKIGEISVLLRFENNVPSGKVDIETEFYDIYESSSEAINWIEVPIALLNGSLVNFQLFGIEEESIDKHTLKEFKRAKLYYQTIRQLELENNIKFSEYNNYSKDGLMCALILKSYLSKRGIGYPLVKTFNCELETSENNLEAQKLIKQNRPNVMAVTYVDFKGNLNGYEFKIPYVNVCLQHCIVTDCHLIENNRYALAMVDKAEENLIYGSDTPIEQVGNVLLDKI